MMVDLVDFQLCSLLGRQFFHLCLLFSPPLLAKYILLLHAHSVHVVNYRTLTSTTYVPCGVEGEERNLIGIMATGREQFLLGALVGAGAVALGAGAYIASRGLCRTNQQVENIVTTGRPYISGH